MPASQFYGACVQASLVQPGLLEFRVLGPLEAFARGTPLLLGGPKEQSVLAVLVLRARSLVSADALIEAVWDLDPPRSAAKNVQTYVSQIRRQLRSASRDGALLTRASGYELQIAPEDVDSTRFEALLAAARDAGAAGAHPQALELLRDALALWRGDALAGLRFSPVLTAEAARLDELRLLAVEECTQVELTLGRHSQLVAPLGALVREHPLRERLWGQLVLALYRCGRQADALRAYQRARATLVGELGLEPGPELRRLESQVLAQDPSLAAPEPVALAPPRPEALPAELLPPPTPLAGRSAQLRELAQAWDEARTGSTRVVLLAGEPGIGKTRLAAEAATEALKDGARVLYGRCDPEALIPFQPVVEALRQYVSAAPLSLLREHLLDTSGQLRRLLPELGRRLPDVVEAMPPPSEERYLLFEAVALLLAAAARREPVLLALDDLHWADQATLLLVRHVARLENVPILIVATYRDSEVGRGHPLAESLALLRRSSAVRRLRLTRLGVDDVAALARHVLAEPEHAVHALAVQVHAETDGNPLFVLEVLRHLRELGSAPAPGDPLAIPEGVREVIGRRLARLSDGANAVLAAAAVAGRAFDVDLVAAVLELDEDAVLSGVEEAVAAQLLNEVPPQVDRYAFSHALVRATLYDELSASRRVRMHRRIAAVLEQAETVQPGTRLAELAHHLAAAAQREDVDRAVVYARRAGDQAMEQLAYEDAQRMYRTGLDVLELAEAPGLARRAELLLALGSALARTEPGAARDVLLQAADVAREAGEPRLLARAAIAAVGQLSGSALESPELGLLQEAEQVLREDDPLLPDVLQAHVLWRTTTELDQAPLVRMSRRSLALARAAGDDRALARATATRLILLAMPADAEERLALANELLELAEALHDDELMAPAHRHRGWALLERGAYAACTSAYEAHRAVAFRTRQPLALVAQGAIDVMAATLDGRYDDAEALLDQLERMSRRFPHTSSARGAPFAHRVLLRWAQHRLPELEEECAARAQAFPQLLVLRAVQAHAAAAAGRETVSRTLLAAAAPGGYAVIPENMFWAGTVFHVAEAMYLIGDAEGAAQLYDVLRPHADRNLTVNGRAFLGAAAYHLGRLAATAGRPDQARSHLLDALQRHRALGSPPWVERTEQALAAPDLVQPA